MDSKADRQDLDRSGNSGQPHSGKALPDWMEQVADGIYCVDCDYVQPRLACAYIMVNDQGRAAFVETNTSLAVDRLLEALEDIGLSRDSVDWIIPTHVHLDHAGGAGALLERCSNATVLAHPRAARHLIDPARLIESSMQVYGEELFKKLYGEIVPCDESKVRTMEDGASLSWSNRQFEFLHTRGHANHHFCIYEKTANGVFTGDSFGIGYPDLQKHGPFLFASSTPTDFDPAAAHESVDRILNTGCNKVFLTHFGRFDDLGEARGQLHRSLDFLEQLLNDSIESLGAGQATSQTEEDSLKNRMLKFWTDQLTGNGFESSEALKERLKMDASLNASGIVFAAGRALKKATREG
tara:strand:- start:164559 stop:165617 length:1059 start_codon:yes stop_codon:yes gene_type:complete